MHKPVPRRKQRDWKVMQATFQAIAAAAGWDKEYNQDKLWGAVNARLASMSTEVISKHDDDVKAWMFPDPDEVSDESPR